MKKRVLVLRRSTIRNLTPGRLRGAGGGIITGNDNSDGSGGGTVGFGMCYTAVCTGGGCQVTGGCPSTGHD